MTERFDLRYPARHNTSRFNGTVYISPGMGTLPTRTDAELRRGLKQMANRVEVLEQSVGRLTQLLVERLPPDVVNPWSSYTMSGREGYRQSRGAQVE